MHQYKISHFYSNIFSTIINFENKIFLEVFFPKKENFLNKNFDIVNTRASQRNHNYIPTEEIIYRCHRFSTTKGATAGNTEPWWFIALGRSSWRVAEEKGGRARRGGKKKRRAEGFGGEVTSPFIKVSNAKCVAAERCFEPRDRAFLINPPRFGFPSRFPAKENAAPTFNFFPFFLFFPFLSQSFRVAVYKFRELIGAIKSDFSLGTRLNFSSG